MDKQAKNTICLWYDGDAEDAARFYAKTFPDSSVRAVHLAPGDYPSGKKGDVLTVEFTVMGIPCLGLNGGPAFKHNEAFSFQVATADQAETDRLLERNRRQRRRRECVRVVQGQMGPVLADHADRSDQSDNRSRPRRRQARVRCDDGDEKDRRRRYRGGAPRLKLQFEARISKPLTVATLVALSLGIYSQAAAQTRPELACLPYSRIGCGCSIRIATLTCAPSDASSSYHLHAELRDGSPLFAILEGRELELKSRRPASQSFSFRRGMTWRESYVGPNVAIEIRYRPGANTCPKKQPEDPCEYFDVAATVVVTSRSAQPVKYEGLGTCGC